MIRANNQNSFIKYNSTLTQVLQVK